MISNRLKFDFRGKISESKNKICKYHLFSIQISPNRRNPVVEMNTKHVMIEVFDFLSNDDDMIQVTKIVGNKGK